MEQSQNSMRETEKAVDFGAREAKIELMTTDDVVL